jgi:hypothetical protein
MIPTTGFRPCFWYTYCHYMAGLFAIKNPTIDGDIYCLYVCIIHRVIILVCSGLLKNNERNSHLPWDIVWTCLRIYIAYLCTFSGVQKFLERINTSYVYIIIYIYSLLKCNQNCVWLIALHHQTETWCFPVASASSTTSQDWLTAR